LKLLGNTFSNNFIKMPTSSHPSRKCNNDAEGNPSSLSPARVSGSKKEKADSPAVVHTPAPAPVVAPVLESALKKTAATPTVAAAHAPVVAPVLEPAPTVMAAPAPVVAPDSAVTPPVVDSPSKKNQASGIVAVASRAPVVSVAPSVEPAPKKQADVADAVNAPDDEELVESSKEDSEEDADNADEYSQDDLEEESEEKDPDQHSDQHSEEDKGTEHEGVHDERAVQGGFTHGNMGQLAVSFSCICILFSIPDIVM
jgi:hypothetical protein